MACTNSVTYVLTKSAFALSETLGFVSGSSRKGTVSELNKV